MCSVKAFDDFKNIDCDNCYKVLDIYTGKIYFCNSLANIFQYINRKSMSDSDSVIFIANQNPLYYYGNENMYFKEFRLDVLKRLSKNVLEKIKFQISEDKA